MLNKKNFKRTFSKEEVKIKLKSIFTYKRNRRKTEQISTKISNRSTV